MYFLLFLLFFLLLFILSISSFLFAHPPRRPRVLLAVWGVRLLSFRRLFLSVWSVPWAFAVGFRFTGDSLLESATSALIRHLSEAIKKWSWQGTHCEPPPYLPPFAMQTASQHLHHKRPAASGEVSPRIKVWRKTSYSTTNSLTVPFQDGSFCIATHALRIRSDHRDFLILVCAHYSCPARLTSDCFEAKGSKSKKGRSITHLKLRRFPHSL